MIVMLTKALLGIFWVVWLLSLLSLLPQPYGQIVMWIGIAFLIIHLAEFLLLRSKLEEHRGGKANFVGTMVFGFGYWLPYLKKKS